jgi:hypothetical protein
MGEPQRDNAVAEFLQKIGQLVPSEVLAFFLAVLGVARNSLDSAGKLTENAHLVLVAAFVLGLVVTPAYLWRMAANDPSPAPKIIHLILSTVAFGVWAYAIGGAELFGDAYQPLIGAVLPIFFMIVAGLIPLDR